MFSYGCRNSEVVVIYFGFRYLESHFRASFKLPDGHIQKWVTSSRFPCLKWCEGSRSKTHLCLLTDLDIWKVIYAVQVSFQMTKSISDILVPDLYIQNFVIWLTDMNIQKAKSFKWLRENEHFTLVCWVHIWFDLMQGESGNNVVLYPIIYEEKTILPLLKMTFWSTLSKIFLEHTFHNIFLLTFLTHKSSLIPLIY